MSNVIDFLERFGCDAQLRDASDEELAEALTLAGVDQEVRTAIVNKDQSALQALLGAGTNVCCLVHKPEEEEEEEPEEEEEEEEEEEDDKEKDVLDVKVRSRRHAGRVA